MITPEAIKEMLEQAKGQPGLGNAIAAIQLGMSIGASKNLELCTKSFLAPAAVVPFINNRDDKVIRFLVSVVKQDSQFWVAFYYEAPDDANS